MSRLHLHPSTIYLFLVVKMNLINGYINSQPTNGSINFYILLGLLDFIASKSNNILFSNSQI